MHHTLMPSAVEPIEHTRLIFGGDANSCIGYIDADELPAGLRSDAYSTARRGELHGVINQIREGLTELLSVPHDRR